MALRGALYGCFMKRRGKDFQVASTVRIVGLDKLAVGSHVYLAPGVVIIATAGVTLDDEVMIAHYSVVTDVNHTAKGGSFRFAEGRAAPICVGRGAWIGANCTVLPGVSIGSGALVAANSAVTRNVANDAVVGGVAARRIR
jgi:acetyltransferase-like isoleucine patch superfamily enzyme